MAGAIMLPLAKRTKRSRAWPGPEHHGLFDAERKAAVDFRQLGKIGELAPGETAPVDAAVADRHQPHDRLQQRALARPVWPRQGRQGSCREFSGDMMNCRHPVIGHDHVGQLDVGRTFHLDCPHDGQPQDRQHAQRTGQKLA